MRHISCILCDSEHKRVIAEQRFSDDYLELIEPAYPQEPRKWVTCSDCGFIYHDPQLDEKDAIVLYERFRDSVFRNESPDEYFDRIISLPKQNSENFSKVEWIHGQLPQLIRKGGRILDIGCGGGVFLYTFLSNSPNWEAWGVEPTPAFAELAARRLNRPVVATNYSQGICGSGFDLITCNQVLEHILDPKQFLREILGDLRAGGYLYLEVPDAADFELLPPDHDRFQMQHLWYFNKESLERLAKLAGLKLVAIKTELTKRGRNNLVVLLTRNEM